MPLMIDSSFKDYEYAVNSSANSIDVIFTINVTSISLSQSDPWYVDVLINASIGVDDFDNLAYWEYNATFNTSVPIDGLRDPLYVLNTNRLVQNIFNKTTVTNFSNVTDLLYHLNNSLYLNSTKAPSFLMRFYNDTTSDPEGITSMVNLQILYAQGLTIYDTRPILDYQYFGYGNVSDANVCNVAGMPSWFKIMNYSAATYGITNLTNTSCS